MSLQAVFCIDESGSHNDDKPLPIYGEALDCFPSPDIVMRELSTNTAIYSRIRLESRHAPYPQCLHSGTFSSHFSPSTA